MTKMLTVQPQNFDYYNFCVIQNYVFNEPVPVIENSYTYEENGVLYCASATEKGVYCYSYCLNNPLMFKDPGGQIVVAVNNAAQQAILNTLPQEIRSQVVFNKDGRIDPSTFNSINSNSQNFQSLSQLVNDNSTYEVNVTNKMIYKNENSNQIELNLGPITLSNYIEGSYGFNTGEEGWLGVFQSPGNDPNKYNSPDGTSKILINSELSEEGQAQVFAHEGYGHAYLYSLGKVYSHQIISTPNGFIENNRLLNNAITRAIEETIINMEKKGIFDLKGISVKGIFGN